MRRWQGISHPLFGWDAARRGNPPAIGSLLTTDVAKYWKKGNVRISLLGLENQSSRDPDIALRVMGYDGAAYRDELNQGDDRYPVVTLVLYFGTDQRWGQKSRCLSSAVGSPDKKIARFIHDYKANIFEIAWLDDETVAKFKSDFRIVADYFVQIRKNHDYIPSAEVMNHVEEVLNLMAAVSGASPFAKRTFNGEATCRRAKRGGVSNRPEI